MFVRKLITVVLFGFAPTMTIAEQTNFELQYSSLRTSNGPASSQRIISIPCDNRFGNPCGPLETCRRKSNDDSDLDTFICEPNPNAEKCSVVCYDNQSTCVRDVATTKFECRCHFGYHKPDPYFDSCAIIPGFDAFELEMKQKSQQQSQSQQYVQGQLSKQLKKQNLQLQVPQGSQYQLRQVRTSATASSEPFGN